MAGATLNNGKLDLAEVNGRLADADAIQTIQWAFDAFGHGLVMTSSFGAESALMIHLATRVVPRIPVIVVDTGYFFPETYVFMEELTKRFDLDLHVYQSVWSAARMEAIHGPLWDKGVDGLNRYDRMRKVEPMERALRELHVKAWLSGVRADQTEHRKTLRPVEVRGDGLYKVHPILKWTTKEIYEYFKRYNLPYHPLYEKGYMSIGDHHSTVPIGEGMDARDGRFKGLKQECGLHLPATPAENESRGDSGL